MCLNNKDMCGCLAGYPEAFKVHIDETDAVYDVSLADHYGKVPIPLHLPTLTPIRVGHSSVAAESDCDSRGEAREKKISEYRADKGNPYEQDADFKNNWLDPYYKPHTFASSVDFECWNCRAPRIECVVILNEEDQKLKDEIEAFNLANTQRERFYPSRFATCRREGEYDE